MRREALLLVEMVDAARQAMTLVAGRNGDALREDRLRRDLCDLGGAARVDLALDRVRQSREQHGSVL